MTSSGRRSIHVPVMPREVLQALQLSAGQTVLDGTLGAGGHSSLILKRILPGGCLIGLDRDPMMLNLARQNLNSVSGADAAPEGSMHLLRSSYVDAPGVLSQLGLAGVDRVLLDLGLSSDQLSDTGRGFGFDAGGPLDMRFDPREGRSAAELLNEWNHAEMTSVFRDYGEDPDAERIATEIIRRRNSSSRVITAGDLEDAVRAASSSGRQQATRGSRNPATRVFQALRIATNQELQHVERMMTSILPKILNCGGIAVILTFHSLEDRIVKNALKGQQGWHVLHKTPVEAAPAEIRLNPRSRSAKLRAVQKV
jgi:16S rRNA (cytosine1402-N4)-methyltransferase